jgi:hypothetical protein
MERLTDKQERYCNKYDIENRCCRRKWFCSDMYECERYSRLQEYEDTGLSPKEIESLKDVMGADFRQDRLIWEVSK